MKQKIGDILEGCATIDVSDFLSREGISFDKHIGFLCLTNMQSVFSEYQAKLNTGWKPKFGVQNMFKNTAFVFKTVGRIQKKDFSGRDDVALVSTLTNHTYRVFYYLVMNDFTDIEIKTDCNTCGRHLATKQDMVNGYLFRSEMLRNIIHQTSRFRYLPTEIH